MGRCLRVRADNLTKEDLPVLLNEVVNVTKACTRADISVPDFMKPADTDWAYVSCSAYGKLPDGGTTTALEIYSHCSNILACWFISAFQKRDMTLFYDSFTESLVRWIEFTTSHLSTWCCQDHSVQDIILDYILSLSLLALRPFFRAGTGRTLTCRCGRCRLVGYCIAYRLVDEQVDHPFGTNFYLFISSVDEFG